MSGGWEHTTQWRDRFERLQQPTIDPRGNRLAEFVVARIIEMETAPRFDLTDELHDTPGGAIAQRYAEHLRKDCVAFRRIVERYLLAKHEMRYAGTDHGASLVANSRLAATEWAMCILAYRWADHPDFQADWRIQ